MFTGQGFDTSEYFYLLNTKNFTGKDFHNLDAFALAVVVMFMNNATTLIKLKNLILQAKTVNQLNAIIIDYTHEEIIQTYDRLTSKQQKKIQLIWEELRDIKPSNQL